MRRLSKEFTNRSSGQVGYYLVMVVVKKSKLTMVTA
jgi:hypothetical protein